MQALAEVTRQSLLQQRTNQINMNVAEAARGHFDAARAADRRMHMPGHFRLLEVKAWGGLVPDILTLCILGLF